MACLNFDRCSFNTINKRNYTFIVSCVSCARSSSSASSFSLSVSFFLSNFKGSFKRYRKKRVCPFKRNYLINGLVVQLNDLLHTVGTPKIPLSLVLYNTHINWCKHKRIAVRVCVANCKTIRWDAENSSKTPKDQWALLSIIFLTIFNDFSGPPARRDDVGAEKSAKQFECMLICGVRVSSLPVVFVAFKINSITN